MSLKSRLARFMWGFIYLLLFRTSPRPFHAWRRFLLKLFGAKMGRRSNVYPSAKIWAPWNLNMKDGACIADRVDCYNVALVTLEEESTVS